MSSTTGSPSSSLTSFTTNPSESGSNDDRGNNNPNNSGIAGGASSSLYLFTFLATLLLLLAVSFAIVMRSFVLRRRFRRRVEEALAAGIILPQQGMRRRDFGEKPRLFDAWLAPSDGKWETMMPVSTKVLSDKYTGGGQLHKSFSGSASSPHTTRPSRARRAISRLLRCPFSRQRADSLSSPSANPIDDHISALPAPGDTALEDAQLQVSVLIAMPNSHRPQGSEYGVKGKERSYDVEGEGEDELPDVVFGITELPWKVRSPQIAADSVS